MVESTTHIKRWFSETLKLSVLKLTVYRLATQLPTEKRKFIFFANALLRRKPNPHYSTLPCAHSPSHENHKAKSYNFCLRSKKSYLLTCYFDLFYL